MSEMDGAPVLAQDTEPLIHDVEHRVQVVNEAAAALGSLAVEHEEQEPGMQVTGVPLIQRGREDTRVLLVHVWLTGLARRPREQVVAMLSTFEQKMRIVAEHETYTQRIHSNPKGKAIPYKDWQEDVKADDFAVIRDQALGLLENHPDKRDVEALFARIEAKLGLPASGPERPVQ